jgi:DNA-binding response OmpR family regulator
MLWCVKRRVLIVDDDPTVLMELMRGMREEIDRWDPIFALGGPAGIAAVREMDFDVVVTDLDMPIADGMAVLAAAREHRSGAVRVLMAGTTAESDHHIVVAKPFTIEQLRAILARSTGA